MSQDTDNQEIILAEVPADLQQKFDAAMSVQKGLNDKAAHSSVRQEQYIETMDRCAKESEEKYQVSIENLPASINADTPRKIEMMQAFIDQVGINQENYEAIMQSHAEATR